MGVMKGQEGMISAAEFGSARLCSRAREAEECVPKKLEHTEIDHGEFLFWDLTVAYCTSDR